MIEINDEYFIRYRMRNWELVQKIPIDINHRWANGEIDHKEYIRYYPTIGMLCIEYMKYFPTDCDNFQEVVDAVEKATIEIKKALKKYELLRQSKSVD